jgi:hypothetical protein
VRAAPRPIVCCCPDVQLLALAEVMRMLSAHVALPACKTSAVVSRPDSLVPFEFSSSGSAAETADRLWELIG